jgi:hypothetical protein
VQVALNPPSLVVTVIVAEPVEFAVTAPVEETVATEGLLEDQVTERSVASDGKTVAVNDCMSPSFMIRLERLSWTPVTAILLAKTVTVQVAVLPPSFVLTVIVAVPVEMAVTTPLLPTVATEALLELQETVGSVALDGLTVAMRVCLSPSVMVMLLLSSVTPVTETTFALTVTVQVALYPPSFVVTVMVVVPAVTAVILPVLETVATEELLEVQVTDWSVASEGETVALSECVSPSVMERFVSLILTLVTDIFFATTVTVHVAVLLPSSVLTVIVVVPAETAVTTPLLLTVAMEELPELQETD